MSVPIDQSRLDELRNQFRSLMASVAPDYDSYITITRTIHQTLANEAVPLIREAAASHPAASEHAQDSTKKDFAQRLNNDLQSLGLCIRDPHSGHPCSLTVAPYKGFGRYQYDHCVEGHRRRSGGTLRLPHLEISCFDANKDFRERIISSKAEAETRPRSR